MVIRRIIVQTINESQSIAWTLFPTTKLSLLEKKSVRKNHPHQYYIIYTKHVYICTPIHFFLIIQKTRRKRIKAKSILLTVILCLFLWAAGHAFETIIPNDSGNSTDNFGSAVAISGDYFIIGATNSDDGDKSNSGAAYLL